MKQGSLQKFQGTNNRQVHKEMRIQWIGYIENMENGRTPKKNLRQTIDCKKRKNIQGVKTGWNKNGTKF